MQVSVTNTSENDELMHCIVERSNFSFNFVQWKLVFVSEIFMYTYSSNVLPEI